MTLTIEAKTLLLQRLGVPPEKIAHFCQRWKIAEFALFGSILRDDFRPDSDVDVLVTFAADEKWSLFDLMDLQRELATMVGRSVDLLEKRELKNPFRRAEILKTHRVLYAELAEYDRPSQRDRSSLRASSTRPYLGDRHDQFAGSASSDRASDPVC